MVWFGMVHYNIFVEEEAGGLRSRYKKLMDCRRINGRYVYVGTDLFLSSAQVN